MYILLLEPSPNLSHFITIPLCIIPRPYLATYKACPSLAGAGVKRALGIKDIRGNQLRVSNIALLESRVHSLHDGNALAEGEGGTLLAAIAEAAGALIGLPEHTVAVVDLGVLGDGAVDSLNVGISEADHLVLGRAECRAKDLDLTLGSLDTDGRAGRLVVVGVGGGSNGGGGNAGHLVLGEVADDAGGLVGASSVLVNGGQNIGRLLLLLEVVESLENPSEGVDTKIKKGTTGKIHVDHTVGVGVVERAVILAVGEGEISYDTTLVKSR